jgi:hypothetical protein
MASGHKDDKNSGTFFEIAGVALASVGSMIFLAWLVASNKIVWGSLKPALALGSMWKIIPTEYTISQWNSVVVDATRFSKNPTDVSFLDWVGFVNTAAMPLMFLICLAYLVLLGFMFKRKKEDIFRAFSPEQLLHHTMRVFSGVAPVIKIRKQIVDNKLPQWRTQVTPEEVFLGKHAGGRPMVQSGEFQLDVARDYFTGLKAERINGMLVSTMLGRQIVDLVKDRGNSKSIVFPDRMSNEGKALFALWACVAFGGQEGKKEYTDYCRRLNMSAYGSPTGMANLTVIQPLYDKYRTNKDVKALFAVHHWEHTVLFALLEIAQRRGRYTTAEVLWLRPTNRVMFFSLNSCGSKTPHAEAASTFNQFHYERACHAKKRLPLFQGADGAIHPFICIDQAIEGLKGEYEHWAISTDENDEWWKDEDIWKKQDMAMSNVLREYRAKSAAATPATPPPEDSPFDIAQRDAQSAADAQEQAQIRAAAGASTGSDFDF